MARLGCSYAQQNYVMCWNYLTEALEIWKSVIKSDEKAVYMPYMASCLYALGQYFAKTGKDDFARRNYEQTLSLREAILPPNHPDISENLDELGKICMKLNDFSNAHIYLMRALALREEKLALDQDRVKALQQTFADCEKQLT